LIQLIRIVVQLCLIAIQLTSIPTLLVPRKVQSESEFMPASSFAVPYNFSISSTCGFAFEDSVGTCFHVEYIPHLALKGLMTICDRPCEKDSFYQSLDQSC